MTATIVIEGVSKRYGDTYVVRDVDLTVAVARFDTPSMTMVAVMASSPARG